MMLKSSQYESPLRQCPTCHRPVVPGAPEGLCLHCLFDAGLVGTDAEWDDSRKSSVLTTGSTRYFGDYELLREVGRGGMGIVYEAHQFGTNRIVALKLLSAGALATREAVNRFQIEAQATARLEHPHIVPIYETGVHDGQYFLAMRFLPGGTLAQSLARGPISPRAAAELVRTIAQAVQHAHQHGVLHRDIKPGNLLLDDQGQPHVTDFGLARLAEMETGVTLRSSVLGTAPYMAPEQAAGGVSAATTAVDIYALGAVLYEALTGRPPFAGTDFFETLRQVVEHPPPKPSLVSRQVAPDLETICLKCLEKEPASRYPTPQDLADDLDRFLRNEPIRARPIGPGARFWRWCRRKPVVAGLVLALQVALALGVSGIVSQWHRAATGELSARQHQYVSDMNRAKQIWEEGNLKLAQDILNAYFPKPGERDLRGFDWRYLWTLCQDQSLHVIRSDDEDPVRGLITSPAHDFIVAPCERSIRLLDPDTGRELRRFACTSLQPETDRPIVTLAAQATNILAAYCGHGVVTVWNLAVEGPPMTLPPLTNEPGALALSPDGGLLAISGRASNKNALTVWDISPRANPPNEIWACELSDAPTVLRFSPAGKTLVGNAKSAPEGTIVAWDIATGRELPPFPKESVGTINDLVFSPDGTLLASSGVLGTVNIWDFTNRIVKLPLVGHRGHVNSLAISPDGKRLASAGDDGTIRLWDISSGKPLGMFRDPSDNAIRCVAFGMGGNSVLSAGGNVIRMWPGVPQQSATVVQTGKEWGEVVISPDGKWLVTRGAAVEARSYSNTAGVTIWDLPTAKESFRLQHQSRQPEAATFSPDGKLFALGGEGRDRMVELWDTTSWPAASPALKPFVYFTNDFEVGSLCFSPDAKIMALAGICFSPEDPSGATNRLAFREVGSWRSLNILEGAGAGGTEHAAAGTVTFSHNGRLLAVGHRDGWVRLWDFKKQRLLGAFKEDGGSYGAFVDFSRDDRWLCASGRQSVALFDVSNPAHAREVFTRKAHIGYCWSAIFAPDSRSLVTAGNDGLIKFWNLDTFAVALTLEHSRGPGVRLSFSPDGNLLVSKDAAGLVKLWSAASFAQILAAKRSRNL